MGCLTDCVLTRCEEEVTGEGEVAKVEVGGWGDERLIIIFIFWKR